MATFKPLSRKRSLSSDGQPNWKGCLCHVTGSDEKVTPFAEKSWNKFEECAKRRKDHIWVAMNGNWEQGPKGGYHRRCYQSYTNIVNISRMEAATPTIKTTSPATESMESQSANETCNETASKRIHRSHASTFDIQKCIICQKIKSMRKKGGRGAEPLTQNISEYGSQSLLRAAEIRKDENVLLHLRGQDCIACEVKYHRTCYKNYTREKQLSKLEAENCATEDKECNSYTKAFSKVQEYVETEVLANAKVVKMTELLAKFVCHLKEYGVEVSEYRSSKLKQRLTTTFGAMLEYQRPTIQSQSELVFSARVKKGQIVETLVKKDDESRLEEIEVEEESEPENNIVYQVYHASKKVRALLLDVKQTMSWPPNPEDLESETNTVPDLLYNMLAWILTSEAEYSIDKRVANLPSHVHRWVLSIGEDLVHCANRGRVKTPKHVLLPMAVKSLTGNAEVVTLLNRFGHGLSYSQIEELETAIAEQQITKQVNGVLLPSGCSPSVPAVFCWDNNDLQEETLSGL